jgi:Zn finger protein HypA/HybF involved in hydrogenase expression
MAEYFDDNFGHWEGMDDPEMREFYHQIQKTNVWKKCKDCGRRVKIQPQYAICNSCAEKRERGVD